MTNQRCRDDWHPSPARTIATKHSEGIGKRNSWQLTTHGEEAVRTLSAK